MTRVTRSELTPALLFLSLLGGDSNPRSRSLGADGDLDVAANVLGPFIGRGSPNAAAVLVEMLTAAGRIDDAVGVLRPIAMSEGGEPYCAAPMLLDLLTEHGRHDEA